MSYRYMPGAERACSLRTMDDATRNGVRRRTGRGFRLFVPICRKHGLRSLLKLPVFLARELERSHLCVLGTYGDVDLDRKHPLSDVLGDLGRELFFGRHPLRGFVLSEVRDYIHAVSGTAPPDRLTRAVCELTNGNPLFVSQMTRLLAHDEKQELYYQEGIADEEIRLPEGVREVIGRRLNHLSKECNEVLVAAVVLGLEFRLRALILTMGDDTDVKTRRALF